jgi:hypothetical protein
VAFPSKPVQHPRQSVSQWCNTLKTAAMASQADSTFACNLTKWHHKQWQSTIITHHLNPPNPVSTCAASQNGSCRCLPLGPQSGRSRQTAGQRCWTASDWSRSNCGQQSRRTQRQTLTAHRCTPQYHNLQGTELGGHASQGAIGRSILQIPSRAQLISPWLIPAQRCS